jgi:hypothetical protein
VLFWMNSQLPEQKVAANQKRVEVSITPLDSLKNDGSVVAAAPIKPEEVERAEVRALKKAEYAVKPSVKARTASRSYSANKSDAELAYRSEADMIAKKQSALANTTRPGLVERISLEDSSARRKAASGEPVLSEVVISSFAADSQRKAVAAGRVAENKNSAEGNVFKASPAGGWEAYRSYLKENIQKSASSLQQKGKVLIGFSVKQDGQLTDFKIMKGLSAKADSLAVQLIKDGPVWKTAPNVREASINLDLDF